MCQTFKIRSESCKLLQKINMIYKTNYRLGLEDVGKFNKITNKAILRILENAGGMQSEKIGYGLTNTEKTD